MLILGKGPVKSRPYLTSPAFFLSRYIYTQNDGMKFSSVHKCTSLKSNPGSLARGEFAADLPLARLQAVLIKITQQMGVIIKQVERSFGSAFYNLADREEGCGVAR